MLISGMTAMAALSSLLWYFSYESKRRPKVYYDGELERTSIKKLISPNERSLRNKEKKLPWSVSARDLIGKDNPLALAKLRMDIENDLRKIAFEYDLIMAEQPISILKLANELTEREIIPFNLLSPIQSVLEACNKAIHGADVENSVAESLVETGTEIILALNSIEVK